VQMRLKEGECKMFRRLFPTLKATCKRYTPVLLFITLSSLPAVAQESVAKMYREQAAQYLAEAATHRARAAELRKDVGEMLKRAAAARASAADWRRKGDTILADKQEREAKQHEFHAEQTLNSAKSEDERAASFEEDARKKQADALKAEELSKAPAPVVYREAAAMLNHLGRVLQTSKQGHSWRVGAQYLEMQSVPDWDADALLRGFNQNDLDNLFRPYEDKIRQLEKSILDRRIALDQGKTSANEFFAGIYADVLEAVSWEWEAELTAGLNGNYALVAYAYKLEKALRKIYRDTDEALRNSVPYNIKTAKLAQLAAQQSEARRGLFNLLAKRYQSQKDLLVTLRRHWSSELGRWQGLASGFSSEANDTHSVGARMFAARTFDLFNKEGRYQRSGSLGPGSVGNFAFVNSPRDYITFPYGDYDWCKARAFPDIQIERCDRLDMYDIVNDKLPAQPQHYRKDGASANRRP
jgi:hypothetical protein